MEGSHSRWRRVGDLVTSRVAAYIFFTLILVGGFFIAKDYGISWDEKAMFVLGEEAYEYVFKGESYPTEFGIRYHGAWFEIVQTVVQEVMELRFARAIFIMRHMLNFVMFWIGLMAIYAIALRTFKSRTWALVAMILLLLSPRQFGHAFFNGRDIPAMTFFAVSMYTLLLFLDTPDFKHAVFHGIACGLVISLRVGLLFLPLYTVLFLCLQMVANVAKGERVTWKRSATLFTAYFIALSLATVAFWPLLWAHPVQHLLDALQNMLWEQQAPGGFYFGEITSALPWHWVPVHVFISTPLLYTVLAVLGCVFFIASMIRRPVSALLEHRNLLLFLLWLFLPIFMVIFLGASLFDEWRHIYFIYPAFLLLAVYALRMLWMFSTRFALRGGLVLLCVMSFLGSAMWMVRNHPLQYAYFSLPSNWIEGRFELDYWGLSFRRGFEWILENDSSDLISVAVTSSPGWENLNILTQDQRRRLVVRKQFDTKYILDNFRWQHYQRSFPEETKVHAITVSGMEVLGIYRHPRWQPEWENDAERMEDYEVQLHFDPQSEGFFEE
ncbi:MAG: hypothetical protein ABIG34_05675 [Candidatus Peregrinibacteria bacterium]